MRDPELAARAGYAAARLEQAWERWRALHGLDGSSDPLASYVGYSQSEPMGQPRVVFGVDAAEAEFFADFLDGHDCATAGGALGSSRGADPQAGRLAADPGPASGAGHLPVNGHQHQPDSDLRYAPVSGPPVRVNGSSYPAEAGPPAAARSAAVAPVAATRAFPLPVPTFTPIGEAGPSGLSDEPGHSDHRGPLDAPAASQEPADVMAAELAGWASGELPGQASEQLASWGAPGGVAGRALNRSRFAR
ncbi:MAG TPA: hypothetical protein VGD68_12825 [Streptosporangiaceae bacterium]